MSWLRKILIAVTPPIIIIVTLTGLRWLAEQMNLPVPLPRLFSLSIAVILVSVYGGLWAHRRGLDRILGVIPTIVVIGLVAQVVIVTLQGVIASISGTPRYINGANEFPELSHILYNLLFIFLTSGLLLFIPALIIYFIIRREH